MSGKAKLIKLILLGDQAVGKSSLLNRFVDNTFENSMGTAGLDLKQKKLNINNEEIKVNIYDSAGHERFNNVGSSTAKQANGLLIVYDVTDQKTFEGARNWLENMYQFAKDTKTYVLLGNKIDLQDKIQVNREDAEEVAKKYSAIFYETSAKEGNNVEKAFTEAVNIIYNNQFNSKGNADNPEENGASDDHKNKRQEQKNQGGCCLIY